MLSTLARTLLLGSALLLAPLTPVHGAETTPAPSVVIRIDGADVLHVDRAVMDSVPPSHVQAFDHGTPGTWMGVHLYRMLQLAGAPSEDTLRGPQMAKYVLVTASDGYRAVFSLAELDPQFGNATVVLAHSRDEAPLSEKEGPFRLVSSGDTKQARWVRNVVSVEVLDAPGAVAPPHAH